MLFIKRIVCAIDFSPYSTLVAEYAVTMAKTFEAGVVVVYVAPVFSQYMSLNVSSKSIANLSDEIMEGAQERMREFVKENFSGVDAVGRVVPGVPADEILALAENSNANMIVMGTRGLTGLERMVFGSVAEKVLKGAFVPVLTICPPA